MVKETDPMENDNSRKQSDRARDAKGVISDSAERWLARNRSLVRKLRFGRKVLPLSG